MQVSRRVRMCCLIWNFVLDTAALSTKKRKEKMAKTPEELELWAREHLIDVSEERLQEEERTRKSLRNTLWFFEVGTGAMVTLGIFVLGCVMTYLVGKVVVDFWF